VGDQGAAAQPVLCHSGRCSCAATGLHGSEQQWPQQELCPFLDIEDDSRAMGPLLVAIHVHLGDLNTKKNAMTILLPVDIMMVWVWGCLVDDDLC